MVMTRGSISLAFELWLTLTRRMLFQASNHRYQSFHQRNNFLSVCTSLMSASGLGISFTNQKRNCDKLTPIVTPLQAFYYPS
jgi:hypothetical protein